MKATLGNFLKPIKRGVEVSGDGTYRQVGVRVWGKGSYERGTITGKETQYKTLFEVKSGDLIINKIWSRNGAIAIVPQEQNGCFVSTEFPTFEIDTKKVDPIWLNIRLATQDFWHKCALASGGTSGKNRIKVEKFLDINIDLPNLSEQHKRIEKYKLQAISHSELVNKVNSNISSLEKMVKTFFYSRIKNCNYDKMINIAPIIRRSVNITALETYPELGIRSFGKGTFHKPSIEGKELGSKKLFEIRENDLLFSNVFAWEGAIAVANSSDTGRFGSHRFISCLCKENLADPYFLRYYFLSPEGMEAIRKASPGSAGRNKTLGLKKLEAILVPCPSIDEQKKFRQIYLDSLLLISKLQKSLTDSELIRKTYIQKVILTSASNSFKS